MIMIEQQVRNRYNDEGGDSDNDVNKKTPTP